MAKFGKVGLVALSILFLFPAQASFAYSIASSTSGSNGAGSGTGISLSSSWNQLSEPFENFFNSLGNVNPTDIPNEISNPSTQIQSMVPAADKGIFFEVLNFISNVIAKLLGISDWIAAHVISWLRQF